MKKIIIISVVIIAVLLIVWKNMSKDQSKVFEVQMEELQRTDIEQIVSSTGNILPVTEVKISANISAEIKNIMVVEGDVVTAGQTLVILDSLKYSAFVEQSQSALRASQASYRKVKAEYERAHQLFKNNLISSQDLESLEASFKLSESNVEQAQARLDQTMDDLHKTILLAPIGGTVTTIKKEAGEMALGSMFQADVLMSISDLSAMEVLIDVDETDVVDIALGNSVEIEVDAIQDMIISGSVSQIAKAAQATSGISSQDEIVNYEVRIMIDMSTMDSRILPGMSATANITTSFRENALALPIQSLTARPKKDKTESDEDEEEKFVEISVYKKEKEELEEIVFIAIPEDEEEKSGFSFGKKKPVFIVEKRPVEIGISSSNFYEILSGVEEGELIITGNYKSISKDLSDGSKVRKKGGRKSGKNRGKK
ncbi:MAG: efflux RND transporter periplasmic adaptor subunit [Candidatus Marinimicrobia bacterium]|nr:efflux RND transporter periplasmic adaptor subunit [Candidatus Neomarinimicrobiota bacterium]